MDANLQSLGVGGILLVLVLTKVFDFLKFMKERKDEEGGQGPRCFTQKDRNLLYDLHRWQTDAMPQLAKLIAEVTDLHKWHDRQDADGVPVWYVRSSLEESVGELAKAIEQLAKSGDANLHALEVLLVEFRASRRAPTEDGN